jgi:O-antigen/teichoic acid export membrane protein
VRRFLGDNLFKAGIAAVWVAGGRFLGLAWTVAVIATLGIADYGLYAMAFSLSSLIAAPLDNAFHVRSMREDESRFAAERTGRALVGVVLLAVGLAVFGQFFVAGFALAVAGGEMLFNACKSRALRDGNPNIVMRLDTARQAASIVVASAYLFLAPALLGSAPSLELACLIYLWPYAVVLVAAVLTTAGFRPGVPGRPKELLLFFVDALIIALHMQGDILLLGMLTDSTITGYYSVASVLAMAVASVGQMYAQTFHGPLREAGGNPAAGPGRKATMGLSAGLAGLVFLAGLVLLLTGLAPQIAVALMILSLFVAVRFTSLVMTTILYIQGKDRQRVAGGAVAAVFKLALVAVLAVPLGAAGAALAAVAAELVQAAWYFRAAHRAPHSEPLPKQALQDAREGSL